LDQWVVADKNFLHLLHKLDISSFFSLDLRFSSSFFVSFLFFVMRTFNNIFVVFVSFCC
jgi:hypothetical protein